MADKKERTKTEIYSRICGYMSPTKRFNEGKLAEFNDRAMFMFDKE